MSYLLRIEGKIKTSLPVPRNFNVNIDSFGSIIRVPDFVNSTLPSCLNKPLDIVLGMKQDLGDRPWLVQQALETRPALG
jgi:hypothetical protein